MPLVWVISSFAIILNLFLFMVIYDSVELSDNMGVDLLYSGGKNWEW